MLEQQDWPGALSRTPKETQNKWAGHRESPRKSRGSMELAPGQEEGLIYIADGTRVIKA